MTAETVDQCAERLVRDDVLVCLSSLIYELNSNDVADQLKISDELLDLSGQHDYEDAAEQHIRTLAYDEIARLLDEAGIEVGEAWGCEGLVSAYLDHLKAADGFRDHCDEFQIEPQFYEAYEFWAVTDWFADKLRDQGETVVELFNMNIWGRCTTGQMIYMDGVLQRIAADLLS